MAKKTGMPHTNECEFYVTTNAPLSFLDKKYVAFGRVIQGFRAFKLLEKAEIQNQRPLAEVKIIKAGEYSIGPLKERRKGKIIEEKKIVLEDKEAID